MKVLSCDGCGSHVADIEKGRVKKNIVCLCSECFNSLKQENNKSFGERKLDAFFKGLGGKL